MNSYIDHTLLKPTATMKDYTQLCKEAVEHGFKTVCVLPTYVPFCKEKLKGSKVLVCSVVSFPLGQDLPQTKVSAVKQLIQAGADEVDFVINYGLARQGEMDYVDHELAVLRDAAGPTVLKAILETSELSEKEVVELSLLCVKNRIDFVKTSTGTTKQGATVEIVRLIKKTVAGKAFVKAAGGIRTQQEAKEMIAAGADRLGTSQGVALVQGKTADSGAY